MSGALSRATGTPWARVTWWGHATATVALGGVRIMTDPLFADRLVHLRRVVTPVPAQAWREVDAVVVSHLHADHLHVPSLRRLPADVRIIAPVGARGVLPTDLAARTTEVVAGQSVQLSGAGVRAVTAAHDGRRRPGSRHRGPALGYVVDDGARSAWFAGDTGLFDDMAAIGPVDLAIVPVGGWGPTLGEGHLDPARAAEAVRRVGARDAVPIHFGTYWPTGLRRAQPATFRTLCQQPGTRFVDALADLVPDARAHLLGWGAGIGFADDQDGPVG